MKLSSYQRKQLADKVTNFYANKIGVERHLKEKNCRCLRCVYSNCAATLFQSIMSAPCIVGR